MTFPENQPFEGSVDSLEVSVQSQDSTLMNPKDEIRAQLSELESRLGDVYRLHVEQGLDHKQVAEQLNVATSGFVYNYNKIIQSILGELPENDMPTGSSAQQITRGVRGFLKKNGSALSANAYQFVSENLEKVSKYAEVSVSNSPEAVAEFDGEIGEAGSNHEFDALAEVPGIYVFSYGWYLENPEARKFGSDATMMKVGRAENILERMKQHYAAAKTVIPEPVVLVRAYRVSDRDSLIEVEKNFHRLLKTAGHENRRSKVLFGRNAAGTEWFLTNPDFLDTIAGILKLETVYQGQSDYA